MLSLIKRIGFTLIEVLMALAIISIAMTAIIKASTQNIQSTTYVEDKMMATWVGLQILNEVRVGLYSPSDLENGLKRKTAMLGREWSWELTQTPTANARIDKISIQVFPAGKIADEEKTALINLESYLYRVPT